MRWDIVRKKATSRMRFPIKRRQKKIVREVKIFSDGNEREEKSETDIQSKWQFSIQKIKLQEIIFYASNLLLNYYRVHFFFVNQYWQHKKGEKATKGIFFC